MDDNENNNENINNKDKKWYDILVTSFKILTIVSLLAMFWCDFTQSCFFDSVIPYFIVGSLSYFVCLIYKVFRHGKITLGDIILVIFFIFLIYMILTYLNSVPITSSMTDKPIIYFYPESATNVNVKLGNPELITCSYPEYNKEIGWNILAEPNGNLKANNKNLYALYWEGNSKYYKKIENDGYIVKGKDTINFLEEKLKCLGLTDREAEEFIVYWLPQMEDNKYNYIRFETKEEIEKNMPLNIEPTPDTIIRVVMDWCEISSERKAKMLQSTMAEQVIETPERRGFVVVEWGGTEMR